MTCVLKLTTEGQSFYSGVVVVEASSGTMTRRYVCIRLYEIQFSEVFIDSWQRETTSASICWMPSRTSDSCF